MSDQPEAEKSIKTSHDIVQDYSGVARKSFKMSRRKHLCNIKKSKQDKGENEPRHTVAEKIGERKTGDLVDDDRRCTLLCQDSRLPIRQSNGNQRQSKQRE